MEQQEVITPEAKDKTVEKVKDAVSNIEKNMELTKQKQLTQLRNRLSNRRRKVSVFCNECCAYTVYLFQPKL